MRWTLFRVVFVRMLREEWRMHSRLFGSLRYATFPAVTALLSVTAVWGLVSVGVERGRIVAGMHGLAFLFGLQTGVVGLVGKDAIGNRLGDLTLVLYSARTLPFSRRQLLGVYFLKDVVYYSALFLLPFSLAILPATPGGIAALPTVALLWASTTGTFLLGAATTLSLIGAATHGWRGWAGVALVGAGGLAGWWATGIDPLSLTPYAWYRSPSLGSALAGGAVVLVLVGLGVSTYDLLEDGSQRVATGRLRALADRLPAENGELVAKSLLDLSRSSGGVWKVPFSAGVLAATGLGMVTAVEGLLGTTPSYPVVLGGMVGLSAFTSYNWLTTFDDFADYETLPVGPRALFRAKLEAFLLVGLPTGLACYGLSVALTGTTLLAGLVGATLTAGVHLYLFGLIVRLAGLSGDDFLFDSVLFGLFSLAVSVALLPVLTVGLALGTPTARTLAGLAAWSVAAGVAGVALYRTAGPKAPEADAGS